MGRVLWGIDWVRVRAAFRIRSGLAFAAHLIVAVVESQNRLRIRVTVRKSQLIDQDEAVGRQERGAREREKLCFRGGGVTHQWRA